MATSNVSLRTVFPSRNQAHISDATVPIWFGAIFTLMGSVFLGIGWYMGIKQHYQLVTFKPVAAHVISGRVVTHVSHDRHGTSTSYEPVINYSYDLQGVRYYSSRLLPIGSYSSSSNWAYRVVNRYPPGSATTAWYDPNLYSTSFLLHEAEFVPHIFALFPSIFAVVGICLIAVSHHNRRPLRNPVPDGPGLFRVAERGTLRHRFRVSLTLTLAWYLYCGVVLGDYFMLNGNSLDEFLVIAGCICIVLGIAGIVQVVRYWRLSHDFLDAAVRISKDKILVGDVLHIGVRLPILRSLQIDELNLGVVCICDEKISTGKGVSYTSREDWSKWEQLNVGRMYQPGSQLDSQAQITVAASAQPSSTLYTGKYPFYRWRIIMKVKAQKQPALEVQYPITVVSSRLPASENNP